VIARDRLRRRLRSGTGGPLTLVSAPAGFGKTTMLVEWLAAAQADGLSVAWVSLGCYLVLKASSPPRSPPGVPP